MFVNVSNAIISNDLEYP